MAQLHGPASRSKTPSRRSVDAERLMGIVTVVILIGLVGFLGFVAGGVGTVMKIPPVSTFMRQTTMAIVSAYRAGTGLTVDEFWYPERLPLPPSGSPIVRHDPAAAWHGLNLVVSSHEESASLITMEGKLVHKWSLRFVDAWDAPPQIPEFGDADREYWSDKMYWRRVHLYPNGDLLVVFETPYRTPYGAGLVKIDRDSKIIWKLPANAHHDTAVAPDGRIFALTQRINETGYAAVPALAPPIMDDMVTVIAPDGKKIRDIPIIEAFLKSDFAPMLDFASANTSGDVTHLNTVQYIDADIAARAPFAEAGQLLISMREMNTVAILDPQTGVIVWAATGMWRAQHEPILLNNGRMLVYDNQGLGGIAGPARVVEFDPATFALEWSYPGERDDPLINRYQGSLQRLPNGNTLIVESINARAIEVDRNGAIVWEYRSPYRKLIDGVSHVALMPDLVRVDPADLEFLGPAQRMPPARWPADR